MRTTEDELFEDVKHWKAIADARQVEIERLSEVKWQPLATAPTDGSEILMFSARNGVRVVRYEPWSLATKSNMKWFIALESGCSGGTYMNDPTHWKPLDSPPPRDPAKAGG